MCVLDRAAAWSLDLSAHPRAGAALSLHVFLTPQETGFISFVVRPLFLVLAKLSPDLEVCLQRIEANTRMWGELQRSPA